MLRAGRAENREYRSLVLLVGFVALLAFAFATGCTTRTAGMQSPLAHDHDGIQWRPLDTPVAQSIIVAPSYTALVENDPGTDVAALRERIAALPDDVRDSELVELRVAIRPAEGLNFDADSRLTVWGPDGEDGAVSSALTDLTFDGEWAVITEMPSVRPGDELLVEIWPGSAGSGWEYGFTPGRVPYGGSPAILEARTLQPVELSGAMGFQSIFEQNTDTAGIASTALDSVVDGLYRDVVLLAIYGGVLVAGAGVVFELGRKERVAGDGG